MSRDSLIHQTQLSCLLEAQRLLRRSRGHYIQSKPKKWVLFGLGGVVGCWGVWTAFWAVVRGGGGGERVALR